MEQGISAIKMAWVSTTPLFFITHLSSQLSCLIEDGANLTLVTSDDCFSSKIINNSHVTFEPLDISREITPFRDMLTLYKLWRTYRKGQFTLVHSFTPKAGLLSAIAAFLARVPVRLHTFTGQRWITLTGVKRHILRFSDFLIARLNTQCYADSPSQADFLMRQGILKKHQIKVLGHGSLAGVNLNRFNPSLISKVQKTGLRNKHALDQKLPLFLFVGRITIDKGVFDLLDAAEILFEKGYEFNLLFIGPFEKQTEAAIRNKAYGISSRSISFVPFSDEIENFFSIADVLCLPSYREGFGTVVIEAAAMEVPTIGSNIYGLTDAIDAGKTGLLVTPRRPRELACAMEKMINQPDFRKKLGLNARKYAETNFDHSILGPLLAKDYIALYLKKTPETYQKVQS